MSLRRLIIGTRLTTRVCRAMGFLPFIKSLGVTEPSSSKPAESSLMKTISYCEMQTCCCDERDSHAHQHFCASSHGLYILWILIKMIF